MDYSDNAGSERRPAPPRHPPQAALPTLSRIPGMPDDGTPTQVSLGGKSYSLSDIVAACRATNTAARLMAVKHLGGLTNLTRGELHSAVSALYCVAHEEGECALEAKQQLLNILENHRGGNLQSGAEALYLALQLIKKSDSDQRFADVLENVRGWLPQSLQELCNLRANSEPPNSKRIFAQARYVVLRALEHPPMRLPALSALKVLLHDRTESLKVDRKDLASNLLSILRAIPEQSIEIQELKRTASFVFATGLAPLETTSLGESEGERGAIAFVTSQQVESNKQFGLATALESRKAMALRGSRLCTAEYAHALRFGTTSEPHNPANHSWMTRAEWNTAHRLLHLAMKEQEVSHPEIIALLSMMATHIKVEDRSDPRDSKARPDLLPAEDRERALREVEHQQKRLGLTQEIVRDLVGQFESSLLSYDFRNWRYQPARREDSRDADSSKPGRFTTAENPDAARLVKILLTNENQSVVTRLTPEELHVLRQTKGLTLEEFKVVTQRLRGRGVACEWTRGAILELVRSEHDPAVSEEVRTAVLGGLVADARKVGKLSAHLEKEVFAVSAEIPALPFLRDIPNAAKESPAALSQ